MSGDAAFLVWSAYIMAGLLCAAELAALALRYHNIRQHLGWRPRRARGFSRRRWFH